MNVNHSYDLSLFEESLETEKLETKVLEFSKETFAKNTKFKLSFKSLMGVLIATFAILGFSINSINSQVELAELTDKVFRSKKLLEESENTENQLLVSLEANLSLREVEEYAKDVLKMRKPEAYQIDYISTKNSKKAKIFKN